MVAKARGQSRPLQEIYKRREPTAYSLTIFRRPCRHGELLLRCENGGGLRRLDPAILPIRIGYPHEAKEYNKLRILRNLTQKKTLPKQPPS